VAVDADRKNGFSNCFLNAKARSDITRWCVPTPKVKAGFIFYFLWRAVFWWFYATTGNLRESRSGAKGLIFIVTKCPANLSATERLLKQVGNCGKSNCILQILSLMNLFIQKRVRKVKILPIQINY
jgi:hypothetical protein